ncbi:MAG: ribosome silencing factor [Alphaproteobacteria bacterium]|nr:ribosome silencing factor [Alphaproteobacteria bacterium]
MARTTLIKTVKDELDKDKAQDILAIDLKGKSAMADYMVIATALSGRHARSMAEKLLEQVKKAHKITGMQSPSDAVSAWEALDFGDVIVHIMTKETRDTYSLEEIWNRKILKGQAATKSAQAGTTMVEMIAVLGIIMIILVAALAGIAAAWDMMRTAMFISNAQDIAARIRTGYANDGNFAALGPGPDGPGGVAHAFSIGALDARFCTGDFCTDANNMARYRNIRMAFAPASTFIPTSAWEQHNNSFSITFFGLSRRQCVSLVTQQIRPNTGFLGWTVNVDGDQEWVPQDFMDPAVAVEWWIMQANDACSQPGLDNSVTGFWR